MAFPTLVFSLAAEIKTQCSEGGSIGLCYRTLVQLLSKYTQGAKALWPPALEELSFLAGRQQRAVDVAPLFPAASEGKCPCWEQLHSLHRHLFSSWESPPEFDFQLPAGWAIGRAGDTTCTCSRAWSTSLCVEAIWWNWEPETETSVMKGWWGLRLRSCFLVEALMGGLEHWAWFIQQRGPYPRFLIQCEICRELNLHFSSPPLLHTTSFCLRRLLPCSSLTLHLYHPRLAEHDIQTPEEKAPIPQPTTKLLLRWVQAEQGMAGEMQLRPGLGRQAFCPGWFLWKSGGRLPFYHSPGRKNRCLCVLSTGQPQRPPRGWRGQWRGQPASAARLPECCRSDGLLGFFKAINTSQHGQPPGGSSWLFLSFKWFTADNPTKL